MSSTLPATLAHSDQVRAILPTLAAAAQAVVDDWQQDEDGIDEELGTGGACDRVAEAMAGLLSEQLPAVEHTTQWCETDTHTSLILQLADGVFRLDVPPHVYETGFGYVWRKRADAHITAEDVLLTQLDPNPAAYRLYIED